MEKILKTRCDVRGKNGGHILYFEYEKIIIKITTKIEDIIIKELTKDKFTILDLETNNLIITIIVIIYITRIQK